MNDFIMSINSELWDIIYDGPHIVMREVKDDEVTRLVPKKWREYNKDDCKKNWEKLQGKKVACVWHRTPWI